MTHTPAPWTVEVLTKTSTGLDVSIISSSEGWADSGMAGQRTIAEVGHWKDRPNPEADARLIAAAPELLEVIEKAIWQIKEFPGQFDEDSDIFIELKEIQAKATK